MRVDWEGHEPVLIGVPLELLAEPDLMDKPSLQDTPSLG